MFVYNVDSGVNFCGENLSGTFSFFAGTFLREKARKKREN